MAVATWGAEWALPLRSSSGNGADEPARGAGEELLCRRKGKLPARMLVFRGQLCVYCLIRSGFLGTVRHNK